MKSSILYYPTIDVPPGNWLRQALMYWDEVTSIVPQKWDDTELIPYTPDIEYLLAEEEFRPIRPENLVHQDYKEVVNLANEFKSIFKSNTFQKSLPPKGDRLCISKIHRDKISYELLDFLIEEQVAVNNQNTDWILFEQRCALLYMSLLAKYLAAIDTNLTVTGTDREEYKNLIFQIDQSRQGVSCIDARFINTLPVPRNDVALSDLISFKRKRKDELLKFRLEIREFQNNLTKVSEPNEIKEELIKFKEKLSIELKTLDSVLKDAQIETVSGTFKTLINLKSPSLWGFIGVASGQVSKITEIPIEWAISGTVILGTVEIGSHLIKRRNLKQSILRDSSFSYLYHAEKQELIS